MDLSILANVRRIAAAAGLALGILVAATSIHLLTKGSHWLEEGIRAVSEGRDRQGIALLENAAKAYLPASPYPQRALDELAILARAREMRGDAPGALHLWRVQRRSILASRHIYQPHADLLERAESEIVRLAAETTSDDDRAGDPAFTVERPEDPSVLIAITAFLGMGAWIAGAVLVLVSPGASDPSRWRKVGGIAAAAGLAAFLLSSYFLD